jgi:hypothetical protein
VTASLQRVDGVLTGLLFDRKVDTVIAFRTGPFHNPTCRYEDFREFVDRGKPEGEDQAPGGARSAI